MVIFGGKKIKELDARIIQEAVKRRELEVEVEVFKRRYEERIVSLVGALDELKLTVENGFDNGETKKTPQQLVREWFMGEEKA
jgi:hypothetical protein